MAKGGGSQSYFSSGLGFGGDDSFREFAGFSSTTGSRPSVSSKNDTNLSSTGAGASAGQNKDAGSGGASFATRATQPAAGGFRHGRLNSRFAVKGSGAREGLGAFEKSHSDGLGRDATGSSSGMVDEHQNRDSFQREERRSGESGAKTGGAHQGKPAPAAWRDGGVRGSGVQKADVPDSNLQSKRAAAAAAAFNVPWRGNPGAVKAAANPKTGGPDAAGPRYAAPAPGRSSNAPAVSQPGGFDVGVLGEKAGGAAGLGGPTTSGSTTSRESFGDQAVPTRGKSQSKGPSGVGLASGGGLAAPGQSRNPSSAPQGRVAPSRNRSSAQYDGLDSIRANYGDRPGFKGAGKRTEAAGISSFLDLNSPPPADATFFDAFADAASGLGDTTWAASPTVEERQSRSNESKGSIGPGQTQGFSLFADEPFAFPAPVKGPTSAQGLGEAQEPVVDRRRPFATMYRKQQAEGLAQGFDKLNLSKPRAPPVSPSKPQSSTRAAEKPAPKPQPNEESASLFHVAPEVLFGGKAPFAFSSIFPPERAVGAKNQQPSKAAERDAFVVFGAQSAKALAAQNPFVFQTPPQAPSNQTAAPGFGSHLPSPSFVQSPLPDPEKAKPAPPQGINAFVFSAGSSGGSASGARDQPESLGKKIGEADSSQFSQSFAERLHLAGAKSKEGVTFEGAAAGTASSLEGLRGFHFKGSIPDEDTTSESFGAGVFGKSQPVFAARDSSPEVGGSPQVPPFVAFGGGGVSPGTPAKRRSEQKMAKKASPSGKTAFTATRSLQRTPVGKPPIPASPKPASAASGVVESGSANPGAGGVPLGPMEEEQEARVESPQPMDISPGRESFENGDVHGAGPEKRVGKEDASPAAAKRGDKGLGEEQSAGTAEAKGFGATVNNRYAATGVGKPRAGVKGPRKAGVNGVRVSASYDGDLEEGSSSFEESEGDKRTAKGGEAWTGRWTPPKEPYEYDSSESDSQSDDDVNPEAQDKDWVRGEKEKLERLKKTAREVGKGGEDGAGAVENESESATGAAEGVEALGADVEEMDLGSVDQKELTESSESDAEDEAESVAKAPNGGESSSAQPAEGVSEGIDEPVSRLGGFKEGERGGPAEPKFNEPSKAEEVPPANIKTDAAPKTSAGSFIFGAGKAAEGPFAFQAQSPGSPPRPPPVAGPFVFASGPTSPKSPRRSSLSRRSMERSDSLRRSTEGGRRRSLERGKAPRQSAEKTVLGVSGPGFAPGAPKGAGRFPEPPGYGASDAAKSSALPEWTFAGSQFPDSPNPTFPNSPNPTFSPSPNPTFPPSPNPTFPASPNPTFPTSPNPIFGNPFFGGTEYADPSKPTFPDSSNPIFPGSTMPHPAATSAAQVQSPKPVRKARRVGPSRARASWDKLHSSSLSGGASSYIDLTADDVASPEAMDEENGNGKRQEVQGPGGRKPSRNQVYYPESSESYFQYFDPTSGAPVEEGAPKVEGGLDDLPPDVVSFSTAQATEAASTCERWRLKGNQAYASKDYKGAEALYTKGVDAVTTGDGLVYDRCAKSAALCLSNRAAVRMALGRVREALSDCLTACAIDPEFEKVRLRAANCHLMLGEFDAARAWYAECAKAGNPGGGGVSIKVWAEACESLKRTEEVLAAVTKAAELLECQDLLTSVSQPDTENVSAPETTRLLARPFRQVSASRASEALKLVSATLVVAGHSEALHELRALALLWLRKFDDVIEFCESSLAASELNRARGEGADGEEEDSDGVLTGVESVRTWRWRVSALAQYHLGKLEEADELAGKVEAVTVNEKGAGRAAASEETLEGLRAFIKELQKHKAAGNAAFQAGKREVAIEHYSAALACNSSSRPFNAVCLANRAAAYQALGSFAEAIADCSRAVVLDPGYAKALSRRATLHELIRDHSESVRDLERLSGILTSRQKASHRDPQLTQEIRGVAERKKKAQEAVQKDVPVDHYKVLGVEKEGGEAEIKKAYRKAALRHHPDKAVQFLSMLKEEEKAAVTEEIHSEAERLFKIIGEAYNVLSNPSKRMAYDADEEDRTFRSSVRNFGRSSRSHGFSRSHGGRGSGASSWSNVRRPFDSEWPEDFFGRKGRGASKSRDDDNSDYYWDADFY